MNKPAEIVLASGNAGKLAEFHELLKDVEVRIRAQSEYSVIEAVEDGLSFVENAIIKARNASYQTDRPALADDSGIAVDALGGKPGIYSARFAGVGANDLDNLNKLLRETRNLSDDRRMCQFVCVIAYVRHATDPRPIVCEGVWHGSVLRKPRGDNGFGYDPIFWVPDQQCSSAELSSDVKNRISHRGLAATKIKAALLAEFAERRGADV